ncbi:hypothetical protein BGX38DRAFT_908334 [Terfezia claveryi]|nr:hypothetical protein BGX38DRAFT_908334 [Terfezia claveryi]
MEFPLPMDSYSDELFRPDSFSCEAILLQLDPSTLLPEFMNRVIREAGRQKVTVDVISKVSGEYGNELWVQWSLNSDQRLRESAFNKIQAEIAAVEEFSCRMLQLSKAPTYTAPPVFSSSVAMDTVYTPSSTCYSSPALPYAQPAPSYGSIINFSQDTQLFSNAPLHHLALTRPQSSISSSYRPKCYKEEMLELNPAETHKWFGEFLKLWIDENWYATEYETVVFINKHQRSIEEIFIALQGTDTITLDLPKWQSVKSGISQKHFYFAAVQTCVRN